MSLSAAVRRWQRALTPRKMYCFVVGKEYEVRSKRLSKTAQQEAQVSLEIAAILGTATTLGISLYFLDPKRTPNTETSVASSLWPSLTKDLEKSVYDGPEEADKALNRIQNTGFTNERKMYALAMGFMVFRNTRRYWARRWGDLEWQRQVLYMPWASTMGLALYMPTFTSFPCLGAAWMWTYRADVAAWAAKWRDPREMLRHAMSAMWLYFHAWFFCCFAMSYAIFPCTFAAARGSIWWAGRRASAI
eukprot:TRINITY_DN1751_c2_g1_i1.p1 TRINITY_DN1751_c2_g1~~TRINITY_DN1751_c2_g1_i1.p1  ORF type:complete len:247 (+),score=65.72 TRINITY_DN1751_c2_g1_i1:68-808(+)